MPSVFPDTGPQPDGTRTSEQWINAIVEDMSIILRNLKDTTDPSNARVDIPLSLAIALKEANRLLRDIVRFGDEVHNVDLDAIERARRDHL